MSMYISSPNYPYNYPNNQACHWLIQATPGYALEYRSYGQFRLDNGDQCQYDNVTLYDSSNTTNIIGTYCGSLASRPIAGFTTGIYLFVSFKSDDKSTFTGFRFEVGTRHHECGTFTSPLIYMLHPSRLLHINSPSYPHNNPLNENCHWLVQAPHDKKIKYRFIGLYALQPGDQCQYDNVTLYDSSNMTNVIGSYCGSSRPDSGNTTGSYLYVNFKSDDSTGFVGFNLEISVNDDAYSLSESPNTYVLSPGQTLVITSPNYRKNYPDNQSLHWLVVTEPNNNLKYRFNFEFKLDTGDQCQYDNVTLYDSSNTTNVIGSYCGCSRPNPGTTTGRYLYVSFKSDDGSRLTGLHCYGPRSNAGFLLEIMSTDHVCGSLTTYELESGHTLNISSPNYPNIYPKEEACDWLVQTAPGKKLRYKFTGKFSIEAGGSCYYEGVSLYDSSTPTNVIGRYCGRTTPNPGTTTDRYLYVTFRSDSYFSYTGFNLEITSTTGGN